MKTLVISATYPDAACADTPHNTWLIAQLKGSACLIVADICDLISHGERYSPRSMSILRSISSQIAPIINEAPSVGNDSKMVDETSFNYRTLVSLMRAAPLANPDFSLDGFDLPLRQVKSPLAAHWLNVVSRLAFIYLQIFSFCPQSHSFRRLPDQIRTYVYFLNGHDAGPFIYCNGEEAVRRMIRTLKLYKIL